MSHLINPSAKTTLRARNAHDHSQLHERINNRRYSVDEICVPRLSHHSFNTSYNQQHDASYLVHHNPLDSLWNQQKSRTKKTKKPNLVSDEGSHYSYHNDLNRHPVQRKPHVSTMPVKTTPMSLAGGHPYRDTNIRRQSFNMNTSSEPMMVHKPIMPPSQNQTTADVRSWEAPAAMGRPINHPVHATKIPLSPLTIPNEMHLHLAGPILQSPTIPHPLSSIGYEHSPTESRGNATVEPLKDSKHHRRSSVCGVSNRRRNSFKRLHQTTHHEDSFKVDAQFIDGLDDSLGIDELQKRDVAIVDRKAQLKEVADATRGLLETVDEDTTNYNLLSNGSSSKDLYKPRKRRISMSAIVSILGEHMHSLRPSMQEPPPEDPTEHIYSILRVGGRYMTLCEAFGRPYGKGHIPPTPPTTFNGQVSVGLFENEAVIKHSIISETSIPLSLKEKRTRMTRIKKDHRDGQVYRGTLSSEL